MEQEPQKPVYPQNFQVEKRFCPKCGHEVPKEGMFCPTCGNQLFGSQEDPRPAPVYASPRPEIRAVYAPPRPEFREVYAPPKPSLLKRLFKRGS